MGVRGDVKKRETSKGIDPHYPSTLSTNVEGRKSKATSSALDL
jgi:hypothetical protein